MRRTADDTGGWRQRQKSGGGDSVNNNIGRLDEGNIEGVENECGPATHAVPPILFSSFSYHSLTHVKTYIATMTNDP